MTPTDFSLNARRSTRIPMRIPVRVGVKQSDGTFDTLNGWTVVLNKHGAKIECARPFELGNILLVTVGNSRSGLGNVVWTDQKKNKNGNFEFGVELREAQNLWGVDFPPNDWERRRAAADANFVPEPEPAAQPQPAEPQMAAVALEAEPEPSVVFLDADSEIPPALPDFPELVEAQAQSYPAVNGHAPSAASLQAEQRAAAAGAPTCDPVDLTHELHAPHAEPEPTPLLSRHMSGETFSAAAATVLNAVVAVLEKRGLITREELYEEMRKLGDE